jgi:hypothetical protein
MLQTYKASGRFSPAVFMLVPALGAGAAGLAKVYQLAIHFIPFIYINAIITLCFGGVLFWGTRQAMRLGKCRNAVVGGLIGLVVGAVGWAAAHYFDYRSNTSHVQVHVPIMDYVRFRVGTGWTIGRSGSGTPLSGFMVYVIWLIEACMIVGLAALGGSGATEPYCEQCCSWAERTLAAFQVQAPTLEAAERIRTGASLADLTSTAGWRAGPAHTRMTYSVRGCPGCEDFNVLTVTHFADLVNKKGELTTKQTKLRENVLLTREEAGNVAGLGAIAEQEAEQPAAEAAEAPAVSA